LGPEANDERILRRKVYVGLQDHPNTDKILGEQLIGGVYLKKSGTRFDQVRVELKKGSANTGGNFIDVFGAELGLFGKTDHQDSFFL
jgi:hypothetical protein